MLLVILSVVFFTKIDAEHTKLENLCQSRASAALEDFTSYMVTGEDSDYISGVAEFRSFMNVYQF